MRYVKATDVRSLRRLPLYYKVFKTLKSQIEEGEYKEGDLLPPEPQLEKRFCVSRITIRKAIEMLEQMGLVTRKQGKGTIVRNPKTVQSLNYITSFTETLIQKGLQVSSRNISVKLVTPCAKIASLLNINTDQKAIKIERIKYADGKPIAIMTNYLLPWIVPGIESKIPRLNSLYRLLEEDYNIELANAIEYIGACQADESEAEQLGVEPGTVLLTSRRITYDKEGRVIEVAILKIIASKYEYCVYLRGRPE